MFRVLSIIMLVAATCFTLVSAGSAEDVALGQAAPLLEITDLTSGGDEVTIKLDLNALEALGSKEIVTSTIWTNGVHQFEGVPLTKLLEAFRLKGQRAKLTAINDYSVEIPLGGSINAKAIVAYRMDGQEMSRRAKGPLWLIYPFDQSSKFRTETVYARSIWQLNRIQVIE